MRGGNRRWGLVFKVRGGRGKGKGNMYEMTARMDRKGEGKHGSQS